MKKILTIIIISLFFPITIFGYSEFLIPGGENIGISIDTKGLIVVGFYKVDGKYLAKDTLKVGDTILSVEDTEINNINELTKLIEAYIKDNKVNITVLRNNRIKNTTLALIKEDNIYKTGLYIKDKINGIGTLTYIDPNTKIFGSLGHEIAISETNNNIEVRSGKLYTSYVSGIDRSTDGTVGSKNATINYNETIGTITKNTNVGLFGTYENKLPNKEYIEVASFDEIEKGDAIIYTILNSNEIKTYNIEITSFNKKEINTSKSISFKIKDEDLIEQAGGIVQGMSGSPIIQNNKIIGSVTHVVVDDVLRGYGVFIKTMLIEGEK